MNELPLQPLLYYLTAPYPCSYLPGRLARSQVATPASLVDTGVYSEMARLGFRRSGDFVYRPRCDGCAACQPVRVVVAEFHPRRRQRRCLTRNQDIGLNVLPLRFEEGHYQLFQRYQAARHAGGGMDKDDREQYRAFLLTSPVDSRLFEFTLAGATIMVSLVDVLQDGLSALYTFYDPEHAKRSLGVYNILAQIGLALDMDLPYLYLGYLIDDCRKMAYKRDYHPLEVLRTGVWERLPATIEEP